MGVYGEGRWWGKSRVSVYGICISGVDRGRSLGLSKCSPLSYAFVMCAVLSGFVALHRKNYCHWQGSQVAGVKISHRALYCVFSSALPIV